MRRFKDFTLKIIIFIVLVLLIEFVVCFTIYKTESVSIKQIFDDTLKSNSENISRQISGEILNVKKEADKDNIEFFDYYFLMENKKIIAGENQILVKEQEADFIQNYNLNFLRYSDIDKTSENNTFYLVVSSKKSENNYNIYLYNAEKIYNSINQKLFTENGLYLETGKKIFGGNSFNEYLSNNYFGSSVNDYNIDNSEEKYLLVSSEIDIVSGVKCYSVGIMPETNAVAFINNSTEKLAIILFVSSIIIFIAFILFAYWITYSSSYYEKLALKNHLYFIKTDNDGNIKKANFEFVKYFSKDINIFNDIKNVSSKKGLVPGDTMLASIEDINRNRHIINFIIVSNLNGYKLLGTNLDSTLKDKEINLKDEEAVKFQITKLYEKQKLITKKMLFGVFKVSNLNNLEAMFGKSFSDKVFFSISLKIKDIFGEIYILSDDYISIMITDENKVDTIILEMQNIISAINKPILIKENLVNVGVKAGFVLADTLLKEADFEYILRCAKAAIKRAFVEKNANYYIYHESQKKFYLKYTEYNYDIENMLSNGSFYLEFQPQYSLSEKRVVGFEALFRIKPVLQLNINVFELIQYAEKTGKMIILGDYIFNEGMKFSKSIQDYDISVSLNVSPIQFAQAGFVDNFIKIYNKFSLKNGSISIEITESFLMTNFEDVINKLNLLHNKGIDFHLDDFGTSYSSFLYLKKLPISAIKIDREFVKDITTNDYSKSITKLIIDLTKSLKLSSIIEGLENKEQLKIVESYGGEIIQGYLFGKSMTSEKALDMIKNERQEEKK